MVATGWVVVQSTWLKREFIFPEREGVQGRERAFSGERGIKKKTENSRGRGEVCPGYLPSAFRHPPMVVLTN